MKKNKKKYNFLVFLYAYLRQADLSLDRSKKAALSELRAYYFMRTKPREAAEYLCRDIDCDENYKFDFKRSSSFISFLKSRFLLIFKGEPLVTYGERCYCRGLLLGLDQILTEDFEDDRVKIEKFRIELAKFNYEIIEPRLIKSDRKKAENIEHFMQSDFIKTRSLSEFFNFKL